MGSAHRGEVRDLVAATQLERGEVMHLEAEPPPASRPAAVSVSPDHRAPAFVGHELPRPGCRRAVRRGRRPRAAATFASARNASTHSLGSGTPHNMAGPSSGTSTTTDARAPIAADLARPTRTVDTTQADQRVGVTVFERRPALTLRRSHLLGDLVEVRLDLRPTVLHRQLEAAAEEPLVVAPFPQRPPLPTRRRLSARREPLLTPLIRCNAVGDADDRSRRDAGRIGPHREVRALVDGHELGARRCASAWSEYSGGTSESAVPCTRSTGAVTAPRSRSRSGTARGRRQAVRPPSRDRRRQLEHEVARAGVVPARGRAARRSPPS